MWRRAGLCHWSAWLRRQHSGLDCVVSTVPSGCISPITLCFGLLWHPLHCVRRHKLLFSVSHWFSTKKEGGKFTGCDSLFHRGFYPNAPVYSYIFPYLLHPFTHIAMAGTIFMTMAISIERYLGLCHPLLNPHSRKAWFYIMPVVLTAVILNVPKFFVSTTGLARPR